MHNTTYQEVGEFVATMLDPTAKLSILDLGARSSNGSYRSLFVDVPEQWEVRHEMLAGFRARYTPGPLWQYVGADTAAGENVDIVLPKPYDWGIAPQTFDVILSGQCLEHVPDVAQWVRQIPPLVKPGGLVLMLAPYRGDIHACGGGHYWLIMPDGMKWLLEDVAGLEVVDVRINGKDCIGLARKVAGKPRKSERIQPKGHGWKGAAACQ